MKKLLFSLVASLFVITVSQAQVCKISESNDNVEVYSCYLTNNNSTVTITVGNDSQNIAANVTIEIEVLYKFASGVSRSRTYTGRGLAKANSTTEIIINILPEIDGGAKPVSVSTKGISGTKCL